MLFSRIVQTLVAGCVAGAVLVLAVGEPTTLAQEKKPLDDKKLKENYELMRMFAETFEQIEKNYVKDVDRRDLMDAAIQGMLRELDQYSSYIPRQQMARFSQNVEQEYGGIGIQVDINPRLRQPFVITPLPGGPAYFKGVRAGDVIAEINGESTEGFTMDDTIAKLKGPRGEEVSIGIRRQNADKDAEVETIKLVRDIIVLDTVRGDSFKDGKWDFMLDDEKKIGYIRLTHFSRRSADELSTALDTLRTSGMKGLVLDLRDNPGGLLSQATRIADMFVEEGKIVSTAGRNVNPRTWRAKKEGTYSGFPMVVLVNRVSASASEIVSACLQDLKRAVVVGERTWGKGSVQNLIDLDGGRSALKLTTASYMRPSGMNIHRFPDYGPDDVWGVKPTEGFEVKFDREERGKWRVDRRKRDIIREDNAATDDENESEFVDRQLRKGLDHLGEELSKAPAVEPPKAG